MKKILITLITLFSAVGLFNSASAMEFDPIDFSYVIHLYYDRGNLISNRDFKFQYDVIGENFEDNKTKIPDPYTGEIISTKGVILSVFPFDPKRADPNFARFPLDVKAPYFANAGTINFYDDSHKLLLTISVGETSVCNENNICEDQSGEDFRNCPVDCKASLPVTPAFTPSASPVAKESNTSILNIVLITLGLIGGISVLIWIIKKVRKITQIPGDKI